jgi:hypothetical protein
VDLVVKHHQRRVKNKWHQQMTAKRDRQRNDGGDSINLVASRGIAAKVDHSPYHGDTKQVHPFVGAEDLRDFHEEVREL